MFPIEFDMIVFKEGKTFVAYSHELDISSCGKTVEQAKKNLKTAVKLFLEEAKKMGTVEDILKETGYEKVGNRWIETKMIATELVGVR